MKEQCTHLEVRLGTKQHGIVKVKERGKGREEDAKVKEKKSAGLAMI